MDKFDSDRFCFIWHDPMAVPAELVLPNEKLLTMKASSLFLEGFPSTGELWDRSEDSVLEGWSEYRSLPLRAIELLGRGKRCSLGHKNET